MKAILRSGVTGILVSHSLPQVRELCTKILWLDHGKQIIFSSDVKLCCDAYEEFLNTKKLPQNMDQIAELAKNFRERKKKSTEEKNFEDINRLKKVLEGDNTNDAINIALNIIKESRPELLK